MPSLTIATWNIEKLGTTSIQDKLIKVSHFIDECVNSAYDIIFLQEVVNSQVRNFRDFCDGAYPQYRTESAFASYNLSYFQLVRKDRLIARFRARDQLTTNRKMIFYTVNGYRIALAHFKSGNDGRAKTEIEKQACWLNYYSNGQWFLAGDMNFCFSKFEQIALPPGSQGLTYWLDRTQAAGNILDWCVYGSGLFNRVQTVDISQWPAQLFDMTDPDHRPVVYSIDL